MATAGAGVAVGVNNTVPIFDARDSAVPPCTEFFVGVRASSSNPVKVNVPGLHNADEWVGIPVGAAITFRVLTEGLTRVYAKGDGGSATIDFGIVSRM